MTTTEKPHILIMDEDEGVRNALAIIAEDDFRVTLAGFAAEARWLIKMALFDAVLTNCDTHGVGGVGIDVIRDAAQSTKPVRVRIAMTDILSRERQTALRRAGSTHEFQKPVDWKAIRDAIWNTLAAQG